MRWAMSKICFAFGRSSSLVFKHLSTVLLSWYTCRTNKNVRLKVDNIHEDRKMTHKFSYIQRGILALMKSKSNPLKRESTFLFFFFFNWKNATEAYLLDMMSFHFTEMRNEYLEEANIFLNWGRHREQQRF